VARNNRAAETGVDEDFGKGSTDYRPSQRRSRPQAQSLCRPDRIGTVLRDGGLSQHARLKRWSEGRRRWPVLSTSGAPIPGLYACGNDMASIMRGHYPGPGITLGPGMVFAYRRDGDREGLICLKDVGL